MPVAVVTGGTDGIGKEVAHALAARRYEVILVGRDRKKGAACIEQIQRNVVGARAVFMRADLSLVREADRLAEAITGRHSRIRLLVHSAGTIQGRRMMTDEGQEAMFATNYLTRFVLTRALLPAIERGSGIGPSHIVFVSGAATGGRVHYEDPTLERGFGLIRAVRQFCRANDLFALGLRDYLDRTKRSSPTVVTCLKLGVVKTNIRRTFPRWMKWVVPMLLDPLFGQAPEAAARTVIDLLNRPPAKWNRVVYTKIRQLRETPLDEMLADRAEHDRLVHWSEQFVRRARGEVGPAS